MFVYHLNVKDAIALAILAIWFLLVAICVLYHTVVDWTKRKIK